MATERHVLIERATMDICAQRNGGLCTCAKQRGHANPHCKDCTALREHVASVIDQGDREGGAR